MTLMPPFAHHRPRSLDRLLELAEQYGSAAKILAGGTELIPKMRRGVLDPQHVISLNYVEELGGLDYDPTEGLRIGAGVRLSAAGALPAVRDHYPALAAACTQMATPQIRNMATVAGNLVNGSPCADTAGPLLVHDATVELAQRGTQRVVPLGDFFRDAGAVDIRPGEILTAVQVPPPPAGSASAFRRLSARSKVDVAAASATALVALAADGTVATARLAIGAVAATPLRCPAGEDVLVGKPPEPERIAEAAARAAALAKPIDDVRATAAYRRTVLPVLIRRVIESCLATPQQGDHR